MGLLFIAALVLAWPTYGLSVLLWLALLVLRTTARAGKITEREARKVFLEPLFDDRFAEFFRALDVPMMIDLRVDNDAARKCGRLIMNYIAHNPEEGALFMNGLKKWSTKGSGELYDPVVAADSERKFGAKGAIHLVSYRAIETLMRNNSLDCFRGVDHGKVMEYRAVMELQELLAR